MFLIINQLITLIILKKEGKSNKISQIENFEVKMR